MTPALMRITYIMDVTRPVAAAAIAQLRAFFDAAWASAYWPAFHKLSTLVAWIMETIPNGKQQKMVVRMPMTK